MNGWVILALLMIIAAAILRFLGVTGAMFKLSAAALLLGASGYALQGHANLAGAPHEDFSPGSHLPLTDVRQAFYGRFSASEVWLTMSEAIGRRGNTPDAVGLLRSAIRKSPGDPMLWVGLGNALVDHAGVMTPPAEMAFNRAAELSPGYPAPIFFRGLAMARSGDPAGAVLLWRRLLAEAPADASWRPLVEDGVAAMSPAADRQLEAQSAL